MNHKSALITLSLIFSVFGCRGSLDQNPNEQEYNNNSSYTNIGTKPSIEVLRLECVNEDSPQKICDEIKISLRNSENQKAGCAIGTINSGGGGFQKYFSVPQGSTEFTVEQWEVKNSCDDLGGPNSILTTSMICGDEKGMITVSCSCICKNYFPQYYSIAR